MGFFSSSGHNSTCPATTTGPQYGTEHIIGSLTFHDLTEILCGIFTAVAFVISSVHILLHTTHMSNPGEQIKIIRVIALTPVYALVYFIAALDLSGAIYYQAWADFYESIALASYFVLLITYLVPNPERRDGFFDRVEHKKGGSSLKWYRRTWIMVFQYIPISFGVAVATDVTQAYNVYCANGDGFNFAHIWLTIIGGISVTLALFRLLAFFKRLRSQLTEHNVVVKLLAIKGIVFLIFVQDIVFTVLNSTGAVKPNAEFTYNDLYYGIPSILICGEMVIFSLYAFYAYSPKPYYLSGNSYAAMESQKLGGAGSGYHGGPFGIKGLLMAMDPREILGGIGQAARLVVSSPPVQHFDGAVGMQPLHTDPEYHPMAPQRAHSPSPVRQGNVEQYTPLARRQY